MSIPSLIVILLLASPAGDTEPPALPERPPWESIDPQPAPGTEASLFTIDVLLRRAEWMLDRTSRESVLRAAELYRFALQLDSSSAEARTGTARAMTTWHLRRWSEDDSLLDRAVAEGRRAVAAAESDPRAHAALAYALMASEAWDEAREAADRAWSLRSKGTPIWVSSVYAQSLLARGDRESALRVTEEALALRADLAALHGLHAQVLLEMERYGDSITPLNRALLLEPDYAPAMIRMAYARDRMGQHEFAGSILSRVNRRFPEEKPRAYLLMAASLMGRQKYDTALQGLGEIRFKSGRGLGEGTRLYLMAVCNERLGEAGKARELYSQVTKEYPLASFGSFTGRSATVASYEALAQMALAEDDLGEAGRLLEQALQLDRPSIDLFLTLSRVYGEHKLEAEAEEVLARAASTDFGVGSSGRKVEIYVAWARLIRSGAADTPPAERFGRTLEALHRHREALLATGNTAWYVEAARACALMRAEEEGIGWLRSAIEAGYRHLDWIAADPEMASLSRHPSFKTLRLPEVP